MGPGSSIQESSVILATLPGKGLVRMCKPGCVHLTYGCITLDFQRPEGFERLMHLVRSHEEPQQSTQVQYGHATLQFNAIQFEEFAALIAVAWEHLDQLSVVRRLLADFPGA